jgi:hypothetical protein
VPPPRLFLRLPRRLHRHERSASKMNGSLIRKQWKAGIRSGCSL